MIFQALFQRLRLKERIRKALSGARTVAYQPHTLVMMLVVHLLLGFRRLRDRDYYRDDPMVQRVLGLQRLPDVSTWTRGLAEFTPDDVAGMRTVNREVVTERIRGKIEALGGVDDLILNPLDWDPASIDVLAEKVLPLVAAG